MSLVNNMLRDLDQRRKESDSSPNPVRLMPAVEILRDPKNRTPVYIALAVLVVANVLLFSWQQFGSQSTTQQLDIRPPTASSAVETTETVTTSVTTVTETVSSPAAAEQASPEPVESVVIPLSEPALTENVLEIPQVSQPAVAESLAAEVFEPQLTERTESNLAEPQSVESLPQNQNPVDVTNVELADSVKDIVQMSPGQLDMQAVQTALGLIDNNQNIEAYTYLEQHIINNPNAHNSRETYAKLLMNDGHLVAAYNLVEAGLQLAPNHAGFKKVMARVLIADGQIPRAVELLSSRAPEVVVDVEYHEILATAQLASRDYRGALISYTELVQQDQSQGRWWYGFAASQDSLGNNRAAYQGYNRAIQQPNLSTNLRRRSQERLAVLSQ